MRKVNVKNGTPVGSEHLCKRCNWGQFVRGHRDSDVLVICTNASPNFTVPFPVCECGAFSDKHRPTFEQMSRLGDRCQPGSFIGANAWVSGCDKGASGSG